MSCMVFQRQLKQKGAGKRVLVCHFGKPHKHALSAGASGRHSPSTTIHWPKVHGPAPTALSALLVALSAVPGLYRASARKAATAHDRLTQSYIEQGRRLLLDGDYLRALPFLAEAYRAGDRSVGLRFMRHRATTLADVPSHVHAAVVYSARFRPGDREILSVDGAGNFMGPGYDDQIIVRLDGKGTVKSVGTPDVTGNYQVQLTGVDKSTPIHVIVAGTPIAEGTVGEPKPVTAKPPSKPGADGGTDPGPGPGPNPGPCGCRRTSSAGTMGLMLLGVLGLVSRRRGRRDDE